MMDYFTEAVLLSQLAGRLTVGGGSKGVTALGRAVTTHPGYAIFGAFLDKVFEHSECTQVELNRLTQARDFWQLGTSMLATLQSARQDIESVVIDPSQTGGASKFANAFAAVQGLQSQATQLQVDLYNLANQVDDMTHIAPEGQQSDQPTISWFWRDIVLSRRTGAFSEQLFRKAHASGDDRLIAFATGVLSRYAVDAVGSAYMNHAVGGPRRTQPFRSRLSSYAIGQWFADNYPQFSWSAAGTSVGFSAIRQAITFGSPINPSMPTKIRDLLTSTLQEIYPAGKVPSVPNLNAGYTNLMLHLELLDGFTMPALPVPIAAQLGERVLDAQVANSPSDPNSAISSVTNDPVTGTTTVNIANNHAGCALCVTVAVVAAAAATVAIAKAAAKILITSTPVDVATFTSSDDGINLVRLLFNFDMLIYAAAQECYRYLCTAGLIYPTSEMLSEQVWAQHLSLPRLRSFPALPVVPAIDYLQLPMSGVELPETPASPFLGGSSPQVLVVSDYSAVDRAYNLCLIEIDSPAKSPLRTQNLNLDADRGFESPCWALNSGTSIDDNPVGTTVLAYDGI